MKLFKVLVLLFVVSYSVKSQSVNAPINPEYNHLVERYEIKQGGNYEALHIVNKPYTRKGIASLADSYNLDSIPVSNVDRFNIEYLRNDNWEWSESTGDSNKPFLRKFYRKQNSLYHVDEEDFNLQVNPVLHLAGGQDNQAIGRPYINTRGVEIRGMISKKLGFYSFLSENQISTPGYVQERVRETGVVPNEAFWKSYGDKKAGFDFFNARGYISFDPIKNINIQFGHDRFFIGNGYRTLSLSDFAAPYLFLKLNTKVWRINYTNIFAQMKSDVFGNAGGLFGGRQFPNKYLAYHHLNVNITNNLSIGAFESVVFGQRDTLSNNSFDVNYLNPVIFYRSIEQNQGSPDNAFVGLDFRWVLWKRISLYGQLMLDEFVLKELTGRTGWWANKFGVQGGVKYIDFAGIKNLDLQGEINIVRPYTYAHHDATNYSHYQQALAHPLGANFKELIGIIRYQPIPRLFIVAKGIYAQKGEDSPTRNFGGNILKDYTRNRNEYGNYVGQGIASNIMYGDITLSYMLKHNFWIDIKQAIRKNDTAAPNRVQSTNYTLAGIRWNIAQRVYEY